MATITIEEGIECLLILIIVKAEEGETIEWIIGVVTTAARKDILLEIVLLGLMKEAEITK